MPDLVEHLHVSRIFPEQEASKHPLGAERNGWGAEELLTDGYL